MLSPKEQHQEDYIDVVPLQEYAELELKYNEALKKIKLLEQKIKNNDQY